MIRAKWPIPAAITALMLVGCANDGVTPGASSWTSVQTETVQACNAAVSAKNLPSIVTHCGEVERNPAFLPERRLEAEYRIGRGLLEAGLWIEAQAKLEPLIERADLLGTQGARYAGAMARANRIIVATLQGHNDQVLLLVDDFRRLYGSDTMLVYRQLDALTQVHKGYALGQLGRINDALSVYDQLITVFAQDPTPDVRSEVLRGCANGVGLLSIKKENSAALRMADDCLARFGDTPGKDAAEIAAGIRRLQAKIKTGAPV